MNRTEVAVVIRLVLSHARQRWHRLLLTTLAIVAAATVVVWVVSGYDSLVKKFDEFADQYLGRYALVVLPKAADTAAEDNSFVAEPPVLSAKLIDALRADPAVAAVDLVFQTRARIEKADAGKENAEERPAAPRAEGRKKTSGASNGPPGGGMFRAPMLVGTDAAEPPYAMVEGQWIEARSASGAAITSGAAKQLKVRVGDEVIVSSRASKPQRLKIVGIVEQRQPLPTAGVVIGLPASRGPPLMRGPAGAALYVPTKVAEQITGKPAPAHFAGVVLKPGAKLAEFKTHWDARLSKESLPAEMQSLAEVEAELDESHTSEHVRSQAWSATGISLLAALFIIFSTLSMGVDERVRQFALLRAIAFTKAHVALMIAIESTLMGLIGWAGGLTAGWLLLKWVATARPELFPVGTALGTWCIALSGLCAVGGALAAAILPAWKATRVSPLDAMSGATGKATSSFSWPLTILGAALVLVNPLVVFWIPMQDTARYLVSAALGCTSMAVGFVLLTPLAIRVTERFLGPLVARLLGLNPQLIRLQLSTNTWRTLGTAVALTLGLGLFVSMQVWGYTMLAPFTPGDWTPQMIVGLTPLGVPDSEIDAVRHVPGVDPARCVPLAAEQVKFLNDVTGAKTRASSSRQDNCVMLGVDAHQALGGADPLFDFRFVEGSRAEAIEKLKQGRYCLVPDHFQRESGLGVGDKFAVRLNHAPQQSVEYEIAGVVNMNGWHWMSKVGVRNHGGGRSAGLMFAPFEQVRQDFAVDRVSFFWMDLDGTQTEEQIKASLQTIADRNFEARAARQRRTGPGEFAILGRGGRGYTATVNVRTVAGVRAQMRERADGIIWMLSQLPLVTLAVTSLGVVNTVLASIRARRWDMGVMRAIGVTRFMLFRMIIVEALLVGLVACLLSLGFGALAGYCGVGITRYVNVRGGQLTHLVIPWGHVLLGFGLTLGLCLLAALWPAIRAGRMQPLRLLQEGRAAN
jgi:putative ABC transport system permease protein